VALQWLSRLFGKKAKIVTQNAMLKSTSVSDFWGRRWNKLVHGALKVRLRSQLEIESTITSGLNLTSAYISAECLNHSS
jgi:hypothetical protein